MIKFADIGYECDDVKITRQVPPEEHTRQVPPEDLFPLLIFIHFYHFSDSLTFIFNWFLCLLMLIIFCLFWTSILNIQWSCSFYVYIYIYILSFYYVIAAACARIIGCVSAHFYTLVVDSEIPRSMNYFCYQKLFFLTGDNFWYIDCRVSLPKSSSLSIALLRLSSCH